jgi:hypothetical protein
MRRLTAIKYLTMLVAVSACLGGIAAATASANLNNHNLPAGDSAQNLVDPDVCQGMPGLGSGKTNQTASQSPLCGGLTLACQANGYVWWSPAEQPLSCGSTKRADYYAYDPGWTACFTYSSGFYTAAIYDYPSWNQIWRGGPFCSDGSWKSSTQLSQSRTLVSYMWIFKNQGTTWREQLYR